MAVCANIIDVAASMKTSKNSPAFKKLDQFLQLYYNNEDSLKIKTYQCFKEKSIQDVITKKELEKMISEFLSWMCE